MENPEHVHKDLTKQFKGAKIFKDEKQAFEDNGADKGNGQGFNGSEILTKDELAAIMDLEDENSRTHQFDRIYPRPSTCSIYYGYMEVKRY